MREILFRGKFGNEWKYGYLSVEPKGLVIKEPYIDNKSEIWHIDPETVGQYTGLTDKNGKRVFEGDVIEFANFFNSEIHRGVVYWCDLAFWFDCTETEGDEGIYSLAYISVNILEVIGNIYDNPELLEVKQNG